MCKCGRQKFVEGERERLPTLPRQEEEEDEAEEEEEQEQEEETATVKCA